MSAVLDEVLSANAAYAGSFGAKGELALTAGEQVDWLTIPDREQAVVDDVRRIREHPLVPGDIPVYGYVYDVRSGKLIEVPDATAAGRVR